MSDNNGLHLNGDSDLEQILSIEKLGGRYRIGRPLGHGGMGIVVSAYDEVHEIDVAIKLLKPSIVGSQAVQEAFEREAQVTMGLSHPNIVQVFDIKQSDGVIFIVMEKLTGRNLREWIKLKKVEKEKFTQSEVMHILGSIADGLEYAHQYTVHRDIKPENIFVCDSGTVKIMDFGISVIVSDSNGKFDSSHKSHELGTPYYMAPEQLYGPDDVGPKVDQYSLAAVGYEMLTGYFLVGVTDPVYQMRPDVHPKFIDTIHKGLRFASEDRFPSIQDFKSSLETTNISPSLVQYFVSSIALKRILRLYSRSIIAVVLVLAVLAMTYKAYEWNESRKLALVNQFSEFQKAYSDLRKRLTTMVVDRNRKVKRIMEIGEMDISQMSPSEFIRQYKSNGKGFVNSFRKIDAEVRAHQSELPTIMSRNTLRNRFGRVVKELDEIIALDHQIQELPHNKFSAKFWVDLEKADENRFFSEVEGFLDYLEEEFCGAVLADSQLAVGEWEQNFDHRMGPPNLKWFFDYRGKLNAAGDFMDSLKLVEALRLMIEVRDTMRNWMDYKSIYDSAVAGEAEKVKPEDKFRDPFGITFFRIKSGKFMMATEVRVLDYAWFAQDASKEARKMMGLWEDDIYPLGPYSAVTSVHREEALEFAAWYATNVQPMSDIRTYQSALIPHARDYLNAIGEDETAFDILSEYVACVVRNEWGNGHIPGYWSNTALDIKNLKLKSVFKMAGPYGHLNVTDSTWEWLSDSVIKDYGSDKLPIGDVFGGGGLGKAPIPEEVRPFGGKGYYVRRKAGISFRVVVTTRDGNIPPENNNETFYRALERNATPFAN